MMKPTSEENDRVSREVYERVLYGPRKYPWTDCLLALIMFACIAGVIAIVLMAAYKAGYRDAELKHSHATGKITPAEIEGRVR